MLVCALALAYFVASTVRWPLLSDATVIHYVNFLRAHGMTPYRDIYDINLPAIYLVDGWQMQLFGTGDLAFRMWEFFLLSCLLGGMIAIARPRDWLAGLLAGVVFIVLHGGDGPDHAAQRDEIVTVLLMLGYAATFSALRRGRPALLCVAGLLFGFAAGIKPTVVPLLLALLALTLLELRRRGELCLRYLVGAAVGFLFAVLPMAGFLWHYHALGDLLDLSTRLTGFYTGLMKLPLPELLRTALPGKLAVVAALALVLAALDRRWTKDWERWAILVGALGGLASYLLQGKGYVYQRHPAVAFATLFVCLQFADAVRGRGWLRWAGAAGAGYCVLGLVPLSVLAMHRLPPSKAPLMRSLEADLTRLGGDRLQHQVQCLDMVDGCLGALYHLGLVQNTGFTGDTLFFLREPSPSTTYYRAVFWQDLQRSPPQVCVVTDEWFNWERGFEKLDHWPEFAAYLAANYTVVESRTFVRASYRIYVRKAGA